VFMIEKVLLPTAHRTHDGVNIVFLYKLKGDLLRKVFFYYSPGEPRNKVERRSKKAYIYGVRLAQAGENRLCEKLSPAHAVRLSISLNYAVFLYDVRKEPKRAIGHAKKAFDDGIAFLGTVHEDDYANSMKMLVQLRDALDRWCERLLDFSTVMTTLGPQDEQ